MQENEMKQDEKEVKQEGKEAEAIKTDEQQTADKEKTVQAKPKAAKKKKLQELEAEIVALKEELAVSKNAYFKAYADADNMKKRLQAEADNVRKYRIQSFASEVLPVLDSLERALDVKVDDQNLKNYVKGFEMIYTQLKSVLEKEGVCEIEALDKPFDPNFHNAVMTEDNADYESGKVTEVLQKGYLLNKKVIRPSMVKVNN